MKYVVEVGGDLVEVVVDGDRVQVDGEELAASLTELPGTPVSLLAIGDEMRRLVVTRGEGRGRYALSIDGRRYDVEALDERTRTIREMSKASAAATGPAPLVAPMPGLIVRINVEVGVVVQPGQGLVVMEAMKMENELRAVAGGVVRSIRVAPGTAVERGTLLVELE